MPKTALLSLKGEKIKDIKLDDSVWKITPNDQVVYESIVLMRAALRQGSHSVKNRGEVAGGGRKPWRQKGTGHARQGSTRSPQWTGGGVVFAPKPRDYSFKMNKREKAIAIKSALTSKVNDSKLIVVDNFNVDEIKTKKVASILSNLNAEKALIVTNGKNENLVLSAKNIPSVRTSSIEVLNNEDKREVRSTINVYDILKYDTLVVTKDAVAAIEEVYA